MIGQSILGTSGLKLRTFTYTMEQDTIDVLLMSEYHSWPLWILVGGTFESREPDSVVKDKVLASKILAWDDRYMSEYKADGLVDRLPVQDSITHDLDGLKLASELASYLTSCNPTSRVRVQYHSDTTQRRTVDYVEMLDELTQLMGKISM